MASAAGHIHRLVNVPARWNFVKPGSSSDHQRRVGHGEGQQRAVVGEVEGTADEEAQDERFDEGREGREASEGTEGAGRDEGEGPGP